MVKTGPEFSPTFRKLSVLIRCKVLHTENGTQPNFAKGEEVKGADAVSYTHLTLPTILRV